MTKINKSKQNTQSKQMKKIVLHYFKINNQRELKIGHLFDIFFGDFCFRVYIRFVFFIYIFPVSTGEYRLTRWHQATNRILRFRDDFLLRVRIKRYCLSRICLPVSSIVLYMIQITRTVDQSVVSIIHNCIIYDTN